MNNDLKPCPFCGENQKIIEYRSLKGKKTYHINHICGTGRSTNAGTSMFETEEEVIAAWNKRAYSWDLLMEILDEVYPPDVFNGESGDVGSGIIMNLREIDLFRQEQKEGGYKHET